MTGPMTSPITNTTYDLMTDPMNELMKIPMTDLMTGRLQDRPCDHPL